MLDRSARIAQTTSRSLPVSPKQKVEKEARRKSLWAGFGVAPGPRISPKEEDEVATIIQKANSKTSSSSADYHCKNNGSRRRVTRLLSTILGDIDEHNLPEEMKDVERASRRALDQEQITRSQELVHLKSAQTIQLERNNELTKKVNSLETTLQRLQTKHEEELKRLMAELQNSAATTTGHVLLTQRDINPPSVFITQTSKGQQDGTSSSSLPPGEQSAEISIPTDHGRGDRLRHLRERRGANEAAVRSHLAGAALATGMSKVTDSVPTEVIELRKKLEMAEAKVIESGKTEARIKNLEGAKELLEREVNDLRKKVERGKAQLALVVDLRQQLDLLQQNYDEAQRASRSDMGKVCRQVEDLSRKNAILLQEKQLHRAKLDLAMDEANKRIAALEQAISERDVTIAKLEEKNKELEEENRTKAERVKEKNEDMTKQATELQAQYWESMDRIQVLERELLKANTLHNAIANRDGIILSLRKGLADAEAKSDEAIVKTSELGIQLAESEMKIDELKSEVAQLRRANAAFSDQRDLDQSSNRGAGSTRSRSNSNDGQIQLFESGAMRLAQLSSYAMDQLDSSRRKKQPTVEAQEGEATIRRLEQKIVFLEQEKTAYAASFSVLKKRLQAIENSERS